MNSYIQKLQSKPEDARKRILIISMITSMSLVAVVWVYGLSNQFGPKTSTQASSDIKPFSVFMASIGSTYNKITASVGSIGSQNKSTKANLEQKQIDLIPVERPVTQ